MQEIEKRMMERGQQMKILKEKMNRVEDEVFRDFCLMLGVSNIRSGFVQALWNKVFCKAIILC